MQIDRFYAYPGTSTHARVVMITMGLSLILGVHAAWADTNPTSIALPLLGTVGAGSPYPSTITVAAPGGAAQIGQVVISLRDVTHPCPEDLSVLLVHGGVSYLLMANAGGCKPLAGTTVTFAAGAAVAFPDNDPSVVPYPGTLGGGVSVYGAAPSFPAPAPAGPYTIGMPPPTTNLNGAWSLYVIDKDDTTASTRGVIASGWTLFYPTTFTTAATPPVTRIPALGVSLGDTGPGATVPVTFDLTTAPAGTRVRDLTLTLNLSHTFPDDLEIFLQSPSGTSVVIMANAGGDVDLSGTALAFTDSAAATLTDAGPTVAGSYRPGGTFPTVSSPSPPPPHATAFSAFSNQPVAGIWRLWIFDDASGDSGTLNGASLTIATEFQPPIFHIDTPTTAATYNATQPFLRVAGEVEDLASTNSATWRNVVNGTYYASGPMIFPATGQVIHADVPLKVGANVISISTRNTLGGADFDQLTVNVSEFDYYLTEGATGSFFDMDIGLTNPSDTTAPVIMSFLPEGGAPIPHPENLGANEQLLLHVDSIVPASSTATVVRSTMATPLAVERSMFWDASYYGGHGGTAVDGASTRWLFAEGSQGFFDTFLLLANDNATAVTTTVRFLREGATPVIITPSIAAHSRLTIYAGSVPGLPGSSFGIDVTAPQPITAERAMYFPSGGPRTFEGGHESAGVTETSRTWFLAEGATGPFFECFVLVSNPNATPANVHFTYLLPGGATLSRDAIVAANGRLTVNLETVDPLLANTPVSTAVNSDIGVVVERAMYWPDLSLGWKEAHNSFGTPDLGLRWGLADGRIGGVHGFQTYVLLANPNPVPAEVQVRFIRPAVGGVAPAPIVKTYTVAATSRQNIWVNDDVPEIAEGSFGVDVRVLNYQPIAVEKAMYWNSGAEIWAGGSNVTASRLPPP